MRLFALFLVACGGAATTTSSTGPNIDVHPSKSITDDVVESRDTEITRDHAIRIAAAAVEWRRNHGGKCPTTRDVIETYTFTSGTEKDASGTVFGMECNGNEIRLLSGDRVAYVTRDEPVDVTRDSISPAIAARIKACYDLALRTDPKMSGAIHGDLVIAKDGTIRQVVVDSKRSTVDSPELLRCVQTKLKGVSSEVDTHGKETRVSF